MGRLFDAEAALLGLGEENHFKGECPMALEEAAMAAAHAPKIFWEGKEQDGRLLWDGRTLLASLLASHGTIEEKALAFHEAIAEMILSSAEHFGLPRILLSGGCFRISFSSPVRGKRFKSAAFLCIPMKKSRRAMAASRSDRHGSIS